jgi:DNA polymerase
MEEKLSELEKSLENCKACDLWKKRKMPVFGEGPENAKVVLIGLGPGYWENEKGRPFVGAAGKLLNQLLILAGMKREEVYITNVVKCYLPENVATDEEVKKCCSLYLDKQLRIIKPEVIITLGNVSTAYIFEKFNLPLAGMSKIHGKIFRVSNLLFCGKVIPMYHPASVLRNPKLKEIVEEDWRKIKEAIIF